MKAFRIAGSASIFLGLQDEICRSEESRYAPVSLGCYWWHKVCVVQRWPDYWGILRVQLSIR